MEISELLEIFETEITVNTYRELVGYAQYILTKNYLPFRFDNVVPDGKTAEDFVQETILKFIDGDRNWNPSENQSIISYLKGNIKSVIYSTFDRKENKITSRTVDKENDEGELEIDIEDDTINSLSMIEFYETMEKIYELVDDDEEVKDILVCIEEGLEKRQEIADYLEISPDKVTAGIKRLHRKLKRIK